MEVVEWNLVELEGFDLEIEPWRFAIVDHFFLIVIKAFDFEVAVRHPRGSQGFVVFAHENEMIRIRRAAR